MSVTHKLEIVLQATTDAFDRGLSKANDTLRNFSKSAGEMHKKMDRFARVHRDALQGLQSAGQAAVVGLGAMAYGIKGVVDEAVKFESAMAGVKKVVDFPTPEAFKAMEKDIIGLSQKLPMTAEGLAEIMAAAGQSNIAQHELLRFTETAAKMGTAFDITAEQAGQALAEMRVAFQMNQDEVEALADKINYLGNTSPNSAAKIMQITQAVGAVAELGGFAADQIAALASGIVGIDPSSVATGLKNISLELTAGTNATKSQKEAFKRLGLDAADVARRMKEDAVGTLMEIATLVNEKIPEYERSAVSAALVKREALPVFAQIVQNQELITGKIKDVGDASKYAGSMLKEFGSMAGTSQAQMQTFSNNITAVKIALGNAFLPIINNVMQSLTPFLQSMADFASNNPELVTTITAVTAGALGLVTVLGGLALAFTAVTSGIGAVIGIGKMIAVIAAPIINAIKFVHMFGAVLAGLGFPVTAVVAGIAALVAGAVLLWQNWDTVKAKAEEVWFAIGEIVAIAVENVKSYFEGIGEWLGGVWESVKTAISTKIDEIKQAFWQWLGGMPAPVQEMVANIISIFDGMAMMWEIIKVAAQSAWQWVKDTAQATAQEIATAWQDFVGDLSATWNDIKAGAKSAWDGVVNATKPIIDTLTNIVKTGLTIIVSVWQAQFTAIKLVVGVVFEGIKAVVNGGINAIKAIFTAGLTVFASVFNAGFSLIKNAFTTTFNVIKALVRGDMQGVANAIRTGLSNAVSIIRSMVGNIIQAFRGLGSQLLQAGRDAIQGLIDGIASKFQAVREKVSQIAGLIPEGVRRLLDIRSPSRVMRALGAWAGEGFVLGVGDKVGDAKQVAENLANALTSTVQDLHRQNFMLLNDSNPLADLEYKLQFGELADLTDKQKSRLLELAKVNQDIQKANEKTANALREQEQSAQNILNANERSKDNYASLQKQIALFGNQSKLAEFDYDWANGAFHGVDNMLLLRERSAIAELEQKERQAKLDQEQTEKAKQAKTAFTQMQGGLNNENPLAKLQNELNERLKIIQDFENAHTGVELEAQKARQQAEEAYLTAKNNLMLDNYQNVFNGISGLTKSFFGEQSGIYRAMFAMEKGFAIAKAIIALKANIAEASKIGFPQNIPMIAGAVSQGVAIVNDIRSVAMPVGQAHDGIMSVPKSGTWNLEKGERVLPRHTAQNLDNTLNRLQGNGGGQVINVNVTVNSDGGDVQSSHDMGKNLGNAIKLAVQAELQKERRQGGMLYGR